MILLLKERLGFQAKEMYKINLRIWIFYIFSRQS